jgi:hypothetical protein
MTVNIAGKTVSVGAIVAGIGGLLAIIGAPLDWANATIGGHSDSIGGLEEGMNGGKAAVALGIIAVILVALWILNVKIPAVAGQPVIPVALVVTGALMIVVVALVYFTNTLGEESLKDLSDMISAAGGSVSVGIGLLLEAVAGIVVIVGGGLALAKKA